MQTLAPVQAVPVRVTEIHIEDIDEPEHVFGRAASRRDPEMDETWRDRSRERQAAARAEAEADRVRQAAIDGPPQITVRRLFDVPASVVGDGPSMAISIFPTTQDDRTRWDRLFRVADRDTGATAEFDRLLAGPLGDPVRVARERLDANKAMIEAAEAELPGLEAEWRKAVESDADLADVDRRIAHAKERVAVLKRKSPILEEAVAKAAAEAKEAVSIELRAFLKAKRDAARAAAEEAYQKLAEAIQGTIESFVRTRQEADVHEFAAENEARTVGKLVDRIAPTKRVREVEPNPPAPRRVRDDRPVPNEPEEPPAAGYCGRHDMTHAADRQCSRCRAEAREKATAAA